MIRALAVMAGALSLTPAAAQGPVGTMPRGNYACELPGDAAGPSGVAQPDANFTIESSSRYADAKGTGTYLKRGKTVTMSSGPRRGESYAVAGTKRLQRVEQGQPGRLRCIQTRG